MTDGDFGGDAGGDDSGHDGGAFDLNKNGTALDEFILFAAITDGERARRSSGGGPAKRSGCLLPVAVLLVLLLGVLAL
ncbi:MAG: hypothetical protein KGN04_00630 [Chloroflexi bacterium]|nr:hypothetical protein [Chloroflexota bacterium]